METRRPLQSLSSNSTSATSQKDAKSSKKPSFWGKLLGKKKGSKKKSQEHHPAHHGHPSAGTGSGGLPTNQQSLLPQQNPSHYHQPPQQRPQQHVQQHSHTQGGEPCQREQQHQLRQHPQVQQQEEQPDCRQTEQQQPNHLLHQDPEVDQHQHHQHHQHHHQPQQQQHQKHHQLPKNSPAASRQQSFDGHHEGKGHVEVGTGARCNPDDVFTRMPQPSQQESHRHRREQAASCDEQRYGSAALASPTSPNSDSASSSSPSSSSCCSSCCSCCHGQEDCSPSRDALFVTLPWSPEPAPSAPFYEGRLFGFVDEVFRAPYAATSPKWGKEGANVM
eukprot:NODE_2025_length_1320_cov_27.796223_g1841_i0.p1 GENE.NODE_2025_length_1320_cov_27.796223_g1841_i0~~NODE_2025_length_1320_cov_27.796223_g1841_i0.p1  ORF type:complete len:333 (+),score=74.74 NODE_2025_length_1320_cov_27.796223_g1841_i0:74-1072(+)